MKNTLILFVLLLAGKPLLAQPQTPAATSKTWVPKQKESAYVQPPPPGTGYVETPKTSASGMPIPRDIFNYVEEMPKFSGDLKAWLSQNSRFPIALPGNTVTVELIVLTDGAPVVPKIKKSGGNAAQDAEALRLVEAMPNWVPGRQNKQLVNVRTQLVINFAP